MKIAIISKADARGGGASKVAEDLTKGLTGNGHEVVHFVSKSSRGFSDGLVSAYGSLSKVVTKLHAVSRRLGVGELVDVDSWPLMRALEAFGPDVVHFHDTSGCFSVQALSKVSKKYKTFWTFHDCSPFTGGCLYDMGCARLEQGCGDCPKIGEWPIDGVFDQTDDRYRMKHDLLAGSGITAIAPSDWMADHAVKRGRLAVRPTVISNGVDTSVFLRKPGVDHSGSYADGILRVTLSAGSMHDSRKGIRHAIAAVRALYKQVPCVVNLIGAPDPSLIRELDGIAATELGYVSGEEAMARALGESDVFLLCSLADNQPLGILEAMSMGLVVGAYAVGGVAGMIEDGVDGILAPSGRPDLLADKIAVAYENDTLWNMQKAARQSALSKYAMEACIAGHEKIYMETTR